MKSFYPKDRYPKFDDIRSIVLHSGHAFGGKPFYKFINTKNEVEELSYTDFSNNVIALTTALCSMGLKGKRIALLSETRPEWLQIYIATVCADAVIVPLDKELMTEQICDFISFAECEALFCSESFMEKGRELFNSVDCLKYISVIKDTEEKPLEVSEISSILSEKESTFKKLLRFGKLLVAAEDSSFYDIVPNIDKECAFIFTSGTTGTSKCVMLSQRNLCSCIYSSANLTPFDEKVVLLSVLPLHHTYETSCGMLTAYVIGATVCLNNSLKYVLRNLKKFQPTAMILVPLFVQTIYKKIVDEIRKKGKEKTVSMGVKITKTMRKAHIDLRRKFFAEVINSLGGRLEHIVCGGAPLDPELVERFEEFGIKVQQGYGITECAPLLAVNPSNRIKYNSVGLPAYECEVKILITEEGEAPRYAEAGEIGEVITKGQNVMLGYFNNDQANKDAFTEDGYFRTGDLGYFDSEGYLYLTGREKNLIILANGKNVYPEEIEEYIYRIDLVKECVVVARKNTLDEQVITALIYPDYDALAGLDNNEIQARIKEEIAQVNKKLPSFKQIRNIEIKKTEFVKTTTKKIKRAGL